MSMFWLYTNIVCLWSHLLRLSLLKSGVVGHLVRWIFVMRLVIITLRRKSSTLDSQSHRCVVDYSTVNLSIG